MDHLPSPSNAHAFGMPHAFAIWFPFVFSPATWVLSMDWPRPSISREGTKRPRARKSIDLWNRSACFWYLASNIFGRFWVDFYVPLANEVPSQGTSHLRHTCVFWCAPRAEDHLPLLFVKNFPNLVWNSTSYVKCCFLFCIIHIRVFASVTHQIPSVSAVSVLIRYTT